MMEVKKKLEIPEMDEESTEVKDENPAVSTAENTEECAQAADTQPEEEIDTRKSAVKKLKAELEAAKKDADEANKKADEANDKYLRVVAEYDNFRKRTQAERAGTYAQATYEAFEKLLPIIDNLHIAEKYSGGDAEKVAQGVTQILGKLPETLDRLGIKEYGAPGDTFDPNLHNAIMHEENPELGENVITDVLQAGYMYGDRVLRVAMVKVAN